ncbi:unnamed protein product, partial [Amoebophrya sp. A25]
MAAQLSPPKSADSLRLRLSLSRNAVPSSSTLTLYPILDEDAGKKVLDQWRTLQDAAAAQGQSFTTTCSFSVIAEASVQAIRKFKTRRPGSMHRWDLVHPAIKQFDGEKPLILEMFKGVPGALKYVEEDLKDDLEFVLKALAISDNCLQYASERLRNT